MKLVVLSLVLINAVYFVWQTQVSEDEALASLRPATMGQPMLLWSEWWLQQDELEKQAGFDRQSSGRDPNAKPRACYTLGPFSVVADANKAKSFFVGNDTSTQQRAAAVRKRAGYWVYVPPQGSLRKARDVLRSLQSSRIEDALIIAGGTKENSISVGVYANQEKAKMRKQQIARLGFSVVVEPLYRTQPQYWLDVELWKAKTISTSLWTRLTQKYPVISQAKMGC